MSSTSRRRRRSNHRADRSPHHSPSLQQQQPFRACCPRMAQQARGRQDLHNIRTHFQEANRMRLKDNPTKRSEKAFATKEKAGTSPNATQVTEPAVNTNQGRYYCWTHGGTYNKNHTSKTCTKKAEGHNCEATFENMLGGNNTLQRKRGETAIWKPKPRPPRAVTPAPGQE